MGRSFHKFLKNKLALISSTAVLLMIMVAIFGYVIAPDNSPSANTQMLQIATAKPGFSVDIIRIRRNQETPDQNFWKRFTNGTKKPYKYIPIDGFKFQDDEITLFEHTGIDGDYLERTVKLVDVLFPLNTEFPVQWDGNNLALYAPHGQTEYTEVKIDKLKALIQNQAISQQKFLLGTDRFGRDLLSRLILGARISLAVGFLSVLISLLLGITLGLVSGYYQGWADKIIMFVVNITWSIPSLLFAIALSMVFGKGYWQLFIAIGLTMWVEVTRIVRGQVLSIKQKDFITATIVLGYKPFRILFRHILPNVINPIIIVSAANFSTAILLEAGLSFLGIGIQPPVPSWGRIIKDHYGFIIVDSAYLAIAPGLAIILIVLCFTFIGNGLRDALDEKA